MTKCRIFNLAKEKTAFLFNVSFIPLIHLPFIFYIHTTCKEHAHISHLLFTVTLGGLYFNYLHVRIRDLRTRETKYLAKFTQVVVIPGFKPR